MSNPAFATNEDGSAKDAAAYRAALLADPEKVKKLQVRRPLPVGRGRCAPAAASRTAVQRVTAEPLRCCSCGSSGARAEPSVSPVSGRVVSPRQADAELSEALLGGDLNKMQETLRKARRRSRAHHAARA